MTSLNIKFGKREFVSSKTALILTLLLFGLFVHLGFWQLDRMNEKKILEENLKSRMQSEPLVFNKELGDKIGQDFPQFRFHAIKLKGKFLNDKNILLDNKVHNRQAGYHVLTPFLISESSTSTSSTSTSSISTSLTSTSLTSKTPTTPTLILVDRGWIPWGKSRSELPQIEPVSGEVTVQGIINKNSNGILLKSEAASSNIQWPYRVQGLDYQQLAKVLQAPVFPFIVQLTENSDYEFTLSPIQIGLPSQRHLGYAVQWFTLSFATLIYYLVIHSRRYG